MEQNDLIAHVSGTLDRLGVPHYVTGSVASGVYGETRTTNDVDVVADLVVEHIDPLLAAFPPDDFYHSREAALQAVRTRSQFNIIDTAHFIKIDVILPKPDAEARLRLDRRRPRDIAPGLSVPLASPEDVIVMKLVYHAEGGSERQLRDVIGILLKDRSAVDPEYVRAAARRMGVEAAWDAILKRADEEQGG